MQLEIRICIIWCDKIKMGRNVVHVINIGLFETQLGWVETLSYPSNQGTNNTSQH